jgi:membrane-associated phospholipid phosphatase
MNSPRTHRSRGRETSEDKRNSHDFGYESSSAGQFLGWPGWGIFREALVLGAAQTFWWMTIYFGVGWLTGLRAERVRIHLDAELKIPFIPALILVYRSIDWMFPLAPFILRSRAEIRGLTLALGIVTGVAGVCFLMMPAEPAYPLQKYGAWEPLYAWNQRIVLSYNMVPSLHVALSVVTLSAYSLRCGNVGKGLLVVWGAAIALSTLLTHQHHLLDVVTGLLLGWVAHLLVYRRWLHRAQAAQSVPANQSSDPARSA